MEAVRFYEYPGVSIRVREGLTDEFGVSYDVVVKEHVVSMYTPRSYPRHMFGEVLVREFVKTITRELERALMQFYDAEFRKEWPNAPERRKNEQVV